MFTIMVWILLLFMHISGAIWIKSQNGREVKG
jgi:hypothetical protein